MEQEGSPDLLRKDRVALRRLQASWPDLGEDELLAKYLTSNPRDTQVSVLSALHSHSSYLPQATFHLSHLLLNQGRVEDAIYYLER